MRIFSLILAACLLFALLPMTVLAEKSGSAAGEEAAAGLTAETALPEAEETVAETPSKAGLNMQGKATPSNAEKAEEAADDDADLQADGDLENDLLTGSEEKAEPVAAQAQPAKTEQEPKAAAIPREEGLGAEDLAGTWTVDGITDFRFEEDGGGALLLPEHDYTFTYELAEDELELVFDDAKISAVTFRASLEDGRLTLEREEKEMTLRYELERAE